MENISSLSQEKCFGCSACANICPINAISMQKDSEGFLSPIVDEKLCSSCGLCQKACIAINVVERKSNSLCYVGWNNNKESRFNSSSGGAFSLFANWILDNCGYICGAMFDEHAQLKHFLTNDRNDLTKLRGSKYLQSELGTIFSEIKEKLSNDFYVLFCGTPCQVAGLHSFLNKDYKKLYTADFVCHGVPSQTTFNEFLHEKFGPEQKYSAINFRNKRSGYYLPSFIIDDLDGNEILTSDFTESFLQGFSKNLYLRKSCSTCKYTSYERVGNITFADFSAVKYYYPQLDYEKGASTIMVNDEKGNELFQKIQHNFEYIQSVSSKEIEQPCMLAPLKTHENRDLFFSLGEMPFSQKVDTCLGNKNIGMINFVDENSNYGALLVSFSMNKVVEKLGYKPFNINYVREDKKERNKNFEDFKSKYLNLTKECNSIEDIKNIQHQFSSFITGGDQVFSGFLDEYTMSWVEGNKKIISYAASMGFYSSLDFCIKNKERILGILNRFDGIGVRENSAVSILNNIGISAQSFLDSTILLEQDDYNKIIEDDKGVSQVNKKYIACMIWDFEDIVNTQIYREMSPEYDFIDILHFNGSNPTFGQLLSLIKNADYTIVNSYHGVAFSIIFNKQFLATRLNDMRDDRLTTMFLKLGIKQNRLFHEATELSKSALTCIIDYTKVNENIEIERKKSFEFLGTLLKQSPVMKYPINEAVFPKNKVSRIKLFGIPNFIKIKTTNNKKVYRLFDFIPLIKIKRSGVYLLGFIKIGRIK